MKIRDSKLYRETHSTFEEYCKERWGFTRSYAYRLIASSEVTDNLSPMGDIPESERVTRPLTKLPPEQQKEAFQKAVETAPEGKVTAKHVEKVVEEIKKPKVDVYKNIHPKHKEIISEEFKNAFMAMRNAIQNARASNWQSTSLIGWYIRIVEERQI